MNNVAEDRESPPAKVKVEVEIEVPGDWIDLVTLYSDLFGRSYVGYWARGVEQDDALGWLVWEDDERAQHGKEPHREEALSAWRAGKPLPAGWFRFDKELALKAYAEGVKRWGVDWYDVHGDANGYDVVLQLAALGTLVYG